MLFDPDLVSDAGQKALLGLKRLAGKHRDKGIDLQRAATRFILERTLARVFSSEFKDLFALKGGMLIMFAEDADPVTSRKTSDVDVQIPGFEGTMDDFREIMVHVLSDMPAVDDGVRFDLSKMSTLTRNEDQVPGGTLVIPAQLGTLRIKYKIDVTFDSRPVFDHAVESLMPSLLPDLYAPIPVRHVPLEWTLADKIHAQCRHGGSCTRFKDFYDMFVILTRRAIDDSKLADALRMTFDLFDTTKVPLPPRVEDVDALSETFARAHEDAWRSEITKRGFAVAVPDLQEILRTISARMRPVIAMAGRLEARDRSAWLERHPMPSDLRERLSDLRGHASHVPGFS